MATIQEFGQLIKRKYPQYQNVPDEQLGLQVLNKYPAYSSTITEMPAPSNLNAVNQETTPNQEEPNIAQKVGQDLINPFARTALTAGQALEGVAGLGVAGLGKIFSSDKLKNIGKKMITSGGSTESVKFNNPVLGNMEVKPINTVEEAIGTGADIGLTLATGAGAGTGGKLGSQVLKNAGLGAGFTTAKALEENKLPTVGELATGAALGGTLPLATAGISKLFKVATERLPKRLMQSVIGQPKSEILAGKDISEYALKSRKIGTLNGLLNNSESEITKLNNGIASKLIQGNSAGKVVNLNSVYKDVADRINSAGGEITTQEVSDIVNGLAPQAKGLLKQSSHSLTDANRLRQLLDKTLGDRAFLVNQLPFNKDVLKTFANSLRESVKTLAPSGTRDLFSTLSKEITLRDALLNKAATTGKNEVVNAFDLLLAGGGFLGGGPVGALGSFVIKKTAQSAIGKTISAQALHTLSSLSPILAKLEPVERMTILNLIGLGDKSND